MRPGEAEEILPGVLRVLAPNPGPMTGPGTNTYVIGDATEAVVVDPGPDDDTHRGAIAMAVGSRTVTAVAVTHHHGDHWLLAPSLATSFAAPFVAHGHPTMDAPHVVAGGGALLEAGDRTLAAVATPGHASDHLCWLLDDASLLTGDHVMAGSTVVIAPPDGDMGVYLQSLEATKRLGPTRLLPGHGPVIEDPGAVLDWYISHRYAREAAVLGALEQGAATVDAVVALVYTDVDAFLHPVAKYSVLAHLLKLESEGRAACLQDSADREGAATSAGDPDDPPPEPPREGEAVNPELPSFVPDKMAASWHPT